MTRYHLYMDESGNFEEHPDKLTNLKPTIVAILVPDIEKEEFSRNIKILWEEFSMTKLHAKDAPKIADAYVTKLFALIEKHGVISFLLRYREDIFYDLPAEYQEVHSANRYNNMAMSLLEYILFLHQPFFGQELEFCLLPNSRVILLENTEAEKIKIMKSMGYGYKEVEKSLKTLFFVWNKEILRSQIMQHAYDYICWEKRLGKRTFKSFDSIVAKDSKDAFVHVVDHLAFLSRSKKHKNLPKSYAFVLDYNREYKTYRELTREYLAGHRNIFFPDALTFLSKSSSSLFNKNFQKMLENSTLNIEFTDLAQMKELEQRVDNYIDGSRGNWEFALGLTENIIKFIEALSSQIQNTPAYKWLLFKLYSHRQRIHNHRGQDVAANKNYNQIKSLDIKGYTVLEYRQMLEVKNRAAVTLANLFDFETANKELLPVKSSLEGVLKLYNEVSENSLYDPILGKICGAMAQNMAFLCSRNKELFKKTEALFADAAKEFIRENDKLRHDINLVHLYFDWGKQEKVRKILDSMKKNYDGVKKFFDDPENNAKYMQFVLAIFLKDAIQNNPSEDNKKWLEKYPLKNLKKWFGPAVEEHPFELICAYMGRMATALDQKKNAQDYFNHALRIPPKGLRIEQPTLQAIRAQIYVWWAMEEHGAGRSESAREKIGEAICIMGQMGKTEGLETILHINDSWVTGWFADGWNAMQKINWDSCFDTNACKSFLDCFTFNYW